MEAYVATCAECQLHKAYTARARGIPTQLEAPDGRWQAVTLDLVSLATSEDGYDAGVVFTNMFTKQVEGQPWVPVGSTVGPRFLAVSIQYSVFSNVCPR